MLNEIALTESAALRAEFADRVDVLDKVKALALLPDNTHMSTELVAEYYEVSPDTIESVARRNADELARNGRRVLRGAELREFETVNLTVSNRRALAIYSRRAVLNVGQLLTESRVAAEVREYLLNVEEVATHTQRAEAVDMVELSRSRVQLLASAFGYLDDKWLRAKMRIQIAIGLGEEPEVDPEDMPLYVPDFLKSKGMSGKQITSAQSWFGRRLVTLAESSGRPLPAKRASDTPNGSIRETYAWTQRDIPLFEEVWDVYYAAGHAPSDEPDNADLFGGVYR